MPKKNNPTQGTEAAFGMMEVNASARVVRQIPGRTDGPSADVVERQKTQADWGKEQENLRRGRGGSLRKPHRGKKTLNRKN